MVIMFITKGGSRNLRRGGGANPPKNCMKLRKFLVRRSVDVQLITYLVLEI